MSLGLLGRSLDSFGRVQAALTVLGGLIGGAALLFEAIRELPLFQAILVCCLTITTGAVLFNRTAFYVLERRGYKSPQQLEYEEDVAQISTELARRQEAKSSALVPEEGLEPPLPRAQQPGIAGHEAIDRASELLKQGDLRRAKDLLDRIRTRDWGSLSPREKYRLLANQGNVKQAEGDRTGAAALYQRAAGYQPKDEDARTYEALGHLFLGKNEEAHAAADSLCVEHPSLGRAHMIRVRAAPAEKPFEELLESVPNPLRADPEVALALHDRARSVGRIAEAEQLLRECPCGDDLWLHITLALGNTILEQELSNLRITLEGPKPADPARLSEAAELITAAIDQIPDGDPEGIAFGAYINRGGARVVLGEHALADADFRKAEALEPDSPNVAIAIARSQYPGRGNVDEAIATLDAYRERGESKLVDLLLSEYLRVRGGKTDLVLAAQILERILPELEAIEGAGERADAVAMLGVIYVESGQGDLALGVLSRVPEGVLDSLTLSGIEADIHRRLGNADEALKIALQAKGVLGGSDVWDEVRRIALLFGQMGEHREAFELWKRILTPDFLSPETDMMLEAALTLGEHSFIVEFSRDLRAAGVYSLGTVGREADILQYYSEFESARDAVLDYLAAKPEDKVARLRLSMLALQRGWHDLVIRDLEALPSVAEVANSDVGAVATDILRSGPNPTEALDYAYELYRRFPDDMASHHALIMACLAPGPAGLDVGRPESVGPGSAVCYRETGTEEAHWIIVEDAEAPSLTRHEFAPSDGLCPVLIGKAKGDEFPLTQGGVRDRTGMIVDIQDKRVYRAWNLIRDWTDRFPNEPRFQSIPIGSDDSGEPKNFDEFLKALERLNKPREERERLYIDGSIPITTLARTGGHSVLDTIVHLSVRSDLPVRVCSGNVKDLTESMEQLQEADAVILDPTAVATLAILDEANIVELLPFRCVVTEGTLQEFRELARDDGPNAQATGFVGARDGRLWMDETDADEATARRRRIAGHVAFLEDKCEVIGGLDLAAVDQEVREMMSKLLSTGAAQSVAAANARQAILWTDDHLLHLALRNALPAARTWTQAVFIWAHHKGLVEGERRSSVSAQMLKYGYAFTSSNAMTVLDMCESASWDPENRDLAAVLADFGNTSWDRETALRMTAETLPRIWREAPTEQHAGVVTARLLAHLSDREDHTQIVATLLDNVDQLLGLYVTRAESLRRSLRMFLETGSLTL